MAFLSVGFDVKLMDKKERRPKNFEYSKVMERKTWPVCECAGGAVTLSKKGRLKATEIDRAAIMGTRGLQIKGAALASGPTIELRLLPYPAPGIRESRLWGTFHVALQ